MVTRSVGPAVRPGSGAHTVVEYDDLLRRSLGEFGRYQRLVLLFVCLTSIPGALNNMTIVFLAAVPDHFCLSPSAAHLGLSWAERAALTAPADHRCQRYPRNYTDWSREDAQLSLNSSPPGNTSLTSCENGWDYDRSTYQSTIVTQWDLVCARRALVPTAASVYMAGLMVGVLLFGFISDTLGRRISFITCSVLMVIFAIAFPFSPNYITFAALRFLLAMANIGLFTTAFVIGVEMVGPSWRVFAGIVIEYFWASGYMIIAGIAYFLRDWKSLALAVSVPQALVLLLIFFMPESPRWLYSQNQHDKAELIVRKMAKFNRVKLPEKLEVEVKKAPKAFVWDLFRYPKLRLRTLNIFFNWFVNSMVYYGLSLNTSNLGGNDYVNFFISGAVEIPAYAFCQLSLRYAGRRWSLAGTMVVGGLSLLLLLAVPAHLNTIAIVLAMVGKFCISASFAIVYVFSAEVFPTVVRNVGVGTGSFWARVGGIIAPYIGALVEVSRVIPYIVFGVLSIAAGLLALALPETKGHQLPETIEDAEKFPHHVLPVKEADESVEAGGMVNPAFKEAEGVKTATRL